MIQSPDEVFELRVYELEENMVILEKKILSLAEEIEKWDKPIRHTCNQCGGKGYIEEQQGKLF